jgi:hypothetical protein
MKQAQKKEELAEVGLVGMPTLIHRGANGEIKKLWNNNKLGTKLLAFFRRHFAEGSYLSLYGLRIPYLFGSWQNDLAIKNLITSAGKAGAASRLNGSGAEAAFTYLELGVGTTAADVADTTLETAITDSGLERAAATCTRVTTTVTNDTAQLDKTWSVSGTKAVTECGIFNAASAGVLLGRQVFTAVNVVSGDSLQVIYKIACS